MDERYATSTRAASCFHCDARGTSEWCPLEAEDLRLLNQAKVGNTYQPGQSVFYQGNPCLGIYCIESGTVAVRKTDPHGNSVIVRLAHSGETLGYRAFFAGAPYRAGADALTQARICFIDKTAVRTMMDRNPAVAQAFLRHMARDLEDAEEARLKATSLSARAQLAGLLLVLKQRFGTMARDGTLIIELPLSRQDLAAVIGTRPETVARAVRALEQAKVAQFNGRSVVIPDLDALMDEADLPA